MLNKEERKPILYTVLTLVAAVGITTGVFIFINQHTAASNNTNTTANANTAATNQSANNTQAENANVNTQAEIEWKTYTSTLYGYSFNYPATAALVTGPFKDYPPRDVRIFQSEDCKNRSSEQTGMPSDCYYLYVHAETHLLGKAVLGLTYATGLTETELADHVPKGTLYEYFETGSGGRKAYVKAFNASETFSPPGASDPIYLNIILVTWEQQKDEAFRFFDEALLSLRIPS